MAEIGELPGGGAPWGGIVKAATPFTDQVTAQLLAQQQDRRKFQQDTTIQADEAMNKELANVRSVDMPVVMDSYGKWKNISMQMLSPRVQNNPQLYNQLQIQKNAALGATMGAINRSAQYNAQMKELVAERKLKPNLFADDFGDRIVEYNKTPMDQLANHPKYGDLTSPDAFRRTSGRTDFGAMLTKAAGKEGAVKGAEKTEKISDLQSLVTPTLFGNTPAQFFDNLRAQLAQAIPGQDAAAAWDGIPDQQKAAVDEQFRQMAPERWLGMTGRAQPQVIAPADPNNGAENWAAYQAKLYAINAAPRAGAPQNVINQQAKMTTQNALTTTRQLALEMQKETDAERRIALQKKLGFTYKQLGAQDQATAVDNAYDDLVGAAMTDEQGQPKPASDYFVDAKGNVTREYVLPSSDATDKAYSIPDEKGHPVYPDKTLYDPAKKTITPIFYLPGKPHTLENIDHSVSKPMTESEYKARYGGALFGKKAAAQAFSTHPRPAVGASGIIWK